MCPDEENGGLGEMRKRKFKTIIVLHPANDAVDLG